MAILPIIKSITKFSEFVVFICHARKTEHSEKSYFNEIVFNLELVMHTKNLSHEKKL